MEDEESHLQSGMSLLRPKVGLLKRRSVQIWSCFKHQ